jgi:DNA-binding CsgD family transcriptional regulator
MTVTDGARVAVVVGRDRELDLAGAFLGRAHDGFAVLVLRGDAGMGKTTLWREVLRRAEADGFQVLACRPVEPEARLAHAAVADLLEKVPAGVIEGLPDPQRRAVDVALLRADPEGPPPAEPLLATAVRAALAGTAEERPVLVAIDDAQWLDASSAAVLAFVMRRLATERVALLVSHRPGPEVPLGLDAVHPDRVEQLSLGPLTVASLHHVIRGQLGAALPRSVLVRVHTAAGGNPLFALEIARVLQATGIPSAGEPLPVPRDVRSLVQARVAELPASTREVLLAAAAGAGFDEERLEQALGRPVDEDLRLAEVREMLAVTGDVVEFAHPLVAEAVYAAARSADRRRVHARLAELAEDLEHRARHLALAAAGPDETVAAALEDAADRAAGRAAPGTASELMELAWHRTPADGARLRRQIRHATLLQGAGDSRRARELLERVIAAAAPGPLRARARLELAVVHFVSDTSATAERLCRAALAEAGDDPSLAAAIHATLARVAEDYGPRKEHAEAALAILDRQPDADPHVLTHALTALAGAEYETGRVTLPPPDLVDRALAVEARAPLPRVADRFSAALGAWLKYADDFDGARRWLEATYRSAVDEGDEGSLPYAFSHLPQLELWTGNWTRAEELARRHLELAEVTGQESQRRQAVYNLATVRVASGREAEARVLLAENLAASAADSDTWTMATSLSLLGVLEASLGNHEAAVEVLSRAARVWRDLDDETPRRHEPELVESLVALGRLAEARAALDSYVARASRTARHSALATAARAEALLRAASGDTDGALAAIDEARSHHDAVDIPLDRARTLLALGQVRRRRRERGTARDAFMEALAIFEPLGAQVWADRTRGEIDRLGLRRTSGDELTAAEASVAELTARGMTNREVAAALFMSPKTVDANLARIYRKLGISSRAELGAWMRGRNM